ncbi:MAG: hypothetical protein WAO00_10700 [Chthoniobacterales bacterium]
MSGYTEEIVPGPSNTGNNPTLSATERAHVFTRSTERVNLAIIRSIKVDYPEN